MDNTAGFANNYFDKIKVICDKIDLDGISDIIKTLEKKIKQGKMIFVAGNGGSAATASHIVCDLGKTVGARALCLSDGVPLLTALGNDCSYDDIFSQPLKNLGKKGDLLLVITGSGNSKNIIKVVDTAKKLGIETIGFLGMGGGKVKSMLDNFFLVPSDEYGPIEDFHLILNHLITAYFAKK